VVRGDLRWAIVRSLAVTLFAPAAFAGTLEVRHDPPSCFVAETFPRLDVTLPSAPASRLRVAFRPEASEAWHGVAAEAVDGSFRAVLPRPRLSARRVLYRFESVGADAASSASTEYSVDVVADAAACPGRVADTEPSARVLVEVPPGAPLVPPVPPGFDPVGAVSATPHQATGKRKLGVLAGVIVGGGAVAGGVLAARSEPPPTTLMAAPNFLIRSITPPPFGQVSIAANNFSAEVDVITPRNLAPGEAWVVFYGGGNPPERPCAVVSGRYPAIEAGRSARFPIGSPFIHAMPCGTTNSARIYFRGTNGQTVYESGLGTDLLDAAVSYTFVP
jgi:hypothetical protein